MGLERGWWVRIVFRAGVDRQGGMRVERTKKSRPKPGESGGNQLTPEVLVESRPADQSHSTLLKVKIAGQNRLDVALVRIVFHGLIQLNNTAELVTVTIFGIGQYELRVVLRGHGERLPRPGPGICEPQHKSPQSEAESAKKRPESQTSPDLRACRVSLAARQQRPVPGEKMA